MRRTRVAFIQREYEDNVGVLLLTACLKREGFDARVWVEDKRSYDEIQAFGPGIVGYSCYTGDQGWVEGSIKRLRDTGLKPFVIVGGPHPTFFSQMALAPGVDAICKGEGEGAMIDLALAIDEGRDASGIMNLAFAAGGEVRPNPLRPLVADLDSLPLPDRSYYERYPFLATNPYKIFITSRGCPFGCTFCFNHALKSMYGGSANYIRRRSVASVMSELAEVNSRWGIDEVRFSDDHFALDAKWLREFAPAYGREIGRPYTVNVRADILDEEKVALLKESGCRLACFGIETGREELRNKVLKKRISDEHIYRAAALLKKYNLKFLTSNIIGLPHESEEDAWQTVRINQEIKTDLPWFSMMQYYPGTLIYEQACSDGLLDSTYDVNRLTSYFRNDYLRQENIGRLQNIHSFSILASRNRWFEPLARLLVRMLPPNPLYRIIFKASYYWLTVRRANFSPMRLLRGMKYYLRRAAA